MLLSAEQHELTGQLDFAGQDKRAEGLPAPGALAELLSPSKHLQGVACLDGIDYKEHVHSGSLAGEHTADATCQACSLEAGPSDCVAFDIKGCR